MQVVVIGAGPAGLMCAEVLSGAGHSVAVYDRMPSPARKFLMAGRGGLNLTHSEPFERFVSRYGKAAARLRPSLEAFTPGDLRAWADGLGAESFVGSSGRVFPKAMKASPLLRAWLQRLTDRGVSLHLRQDWLGWDDEKLVFEQEKRFTIQADAVILALGGASWPRLGGDGGWKTILEAEGVPVKPFQPSNVGFNTGWTQLFTERHAGTPLKTIALTFGGKTVRGEVMLTRHGVEGGAIYALSAALRDAIVRHGHADLVIDLRPDLNAGQVISKLGRASPKDSLSNRLRKALGLTPTAIALMHETGATDVKAVTVRLTGVQGLDRAISSAGGIALEAVSDSFELKALPGVYAVGEMLDWEAPTGGYLLQACFSTAVMAARAIANSAQA
ncbi:NAD(FAD)-utilizing dehydrogenase [Asticcacaulis sp. AC460]|uniref:NAD(P)/FAD-dependent oxidoreductase n=1 Tax=Asticcacaulis sp. AC460 TaxID=1282360 RepID=UPI0003C3E798|nr:TIGR03862 family flavoprotein [Asticcacaulis sp. AC460]ESQ87455.1 NAD(FAD)-utilizing dehydrogenase [Asticcacaulis sp. AC460]